MSNLDVLKQYLEYETPEVVFEVEKNPIRQFAEAIGDMNPMYYDEEYAKKTVIGKIMAPPTFVTTFRRDQRIQFDGTKGTRLHGEQSYYYYKPITVGMKIKCKTKVVEVYEKVSRGNRLTFAVFEQTGIDLDTDELVFVGRQTSIFRERSENLA